MTSSLLLLGLSVAAISGSAAHYYFFQCGKDHPVPPKGTENVTLCLIVAFAGIVGAAVSILQMTQ
jgi:hypothetical protein